MSPHITSLSGQKIVKFLTQHLLKTGTAALTVQVNSAAGGTNCSADDRTGYAAAVTGLELNYIKSDSQYGT